MNPKVFLSHASEDKERFVLGFATRLRGKGIEAWLDRWEILPGDSLIEKIYEEGIKNAQAIIVVLSNHSVSKPWVKDELNAAVVKRIEGISKLIPVVIDDCEVPAALRTTVWETIRDLNNYDSEFERIVAAIFDHRSKPPLGKPPVYTNIINEVIPNLTTIDSLVFKLACETAVSQRLAYVGDVGRLLEKAKPLEIAEEEFYESLEILNSRGYIKGGKVFDGKNRIHYFSITTFGFDEYAKTYVENYGSLIQLIGLQILNHNQRSSLEISAALNQPILIINHVLDLFEAKQMIRVLKTSGGNDEVLIHTVEAELRRRLGEKR